MALSLNTNTPAAHSSELLHEIHEHGTPLRINGQVDGQAETYYVLSASQLMQLMRHSQIDATNVDDSMVFTAEDFGLTEGDLAVHEAHSKALHQQFDTSKQKPIATELATRISTLHQLTDENAQENEREKLLLELETSMLENLQSVIPEQA